MQITGNASPSKIRVFLKGVGSVQRRARLLDGVRRWFNLRPGARKAVRWGRGARHRQ